MRNPGSANLILSEQRKFFSTGQTKDLSFRENQLEKLESVVKAHESSILEALKADMNKPEFEAYSAEVALCLDEIRHARKNLRKWAKSVKVPTPLSHFFSTSRILIEPLGSVLVIAPWNYPFQLTLAPMVSAMAAGNCVVVKPSEIAPNTSKIIAKIIRETFSPEYVACVEGGADATQDLLKEPFDHFFFTGGARVGRIVMEAAAKHLSPVTLELGGKSPCIVDQDFPLAHAARRIIWGKFFNAGQTCVAPDYLLVQESVKTKLLEEMKTVLQEFFGSEPKKSESYARIVNEGHFNRLTSLIDKHKAQVFVGGEYFVKERYIAPTVLDPIQPSDPIMQDEIFGPILPVLTFKNLDHALELVHQFPKPLALYYFSTSPSNQERVLTSTSFGGGCINDTLIHLSSAHLPFGGVGPSGMGAYHGKAGFFLFSHQKSVLQKTSLFDIKLRYPPYTKEKMAIVRKLL